MSASAAEAAGAWMSGSHESARIQALEAYRHLGPAARASLDRLAELAVCTLGGSRAVVTLIDEDTVWLAGSSGFDCAAFEREGSFCGSVLERGKPLWVCDARGDPLHADHALVRFYDIRSYAGVAVRNGDGQRVGTLAVFAENAHAFSPAVIDDLEQVSELVTQFLAECAPLRPPRRVQGWLGVRTLRSRRGRDGLVVLSVSRSGPAAIAGLRPTDILYAIDGQPLRSPPDVVASLSNRAIGESVTISYRRAGAWRECTVAIEGCGATDVHPVQT